MKRLKRFIGYCLIIGSTTVGLAMLTGHGYLYKGIKEVWLRGWSSGNIDDLQFAYDTRVLKASDPLLWAEDLGRVALDDSTLKWMDEELSASFLVISNDTIIYENEQYEAPGGPASYCSLTARKQKQDVNLYTKFNSSYPLEEYFKQNKMVENKLY